MNRFCYQIYKNSLAGELIQNGDRIIVSLSGGVDSLSLSCLLCEFREKIDLQLHWVHFNHGLRAESLQEETFIRDLAAQKNISLDVIKTDALNGEKGMQNKARQWRYDNLLRIRTKLSYDKIALGHHLNDLIETQIWRLLRGSSLFSLNPMVKVNLPYIRPLLHTSKSALESYLRETGQEWCEDSSNASDDYTRNLIRHKIVPIMQQCAGGNLEEKFLGLDTDAHLLKDMFQENVPPDCYERNSLAYSVIMDYHPLFAHELIHRFLLYNGQLEIN